MKILANPIEQHLKRAERRINLKYTYMELELLHGRKRLLAEAVIAGGEPSPEFLQSSALENLTPIELANLIISKPDDIMVKENARRDLILQVRAATTVDQINKVLTDNNVPPHFDDMRSELI